MILNCKLVSFQYTLRSSFRALKKVANNTEGILRGCKHDLQLKKVSMHVSDSLFRRGSDTNWRFAITAVDYRPHAHDALMHGCLNTVVLFNVELR